ncbi:hypothetical protein C2869_00580 [Saccharobesus litoralis]|uniref:histidine kinase n=1 Tax=Saccharobesus litoralis TaxID=2172099 RepID=A0A2S0VLE9_9ALTE|nr:PAS domain S-box protein [Saccharobesus litoralis]AWB65027.1 hypothetical protein C2869_00580 [Saccharobesus litoralis]
MDSNNSYLKKELYQLIKTDDRVFDFIQDACLDGFWYWDIEKPENEWMNDKFWHVLGYDPTDKKPLAAEWQNIINQDDLRVAMDNFNKHCADPGHSYDQVVRYKHKNGSTVWIRCRGFALRDQNNMPIRMIGSHIDITEQKLFEANLQNKNDELDQAFSQSEQLFELAPDANLMVDINGNIIKANQQATALFGYSNEEFNHLNIQQLLISSQNAQHADNIKHYFQTGGSRKMGAQRGKLQAVTKSGDIIFVEITLNLLDTAAGKLALATIRDVTDKEALIAKLEYQIAENKRLEQFAFAASHDLQEPLRKIISFSDSVESRISPLLNKDERVKYEFSRIIHSAERMRSMVSDIQRLSQIDSGKLHLSQCCLYDIVENVKLDLAMSINSSQAIINVESKANDFIADKNLITLLIENLVSNAIKFRNTDSTTIINIDQQDHHNLTSISVSDNGIGIAAKYKHMIFDAFFKLHPKSQFEGSGIGLATCKHIIEAHGGTIECRSELGHGTSFIFTLPQN